MVSKRLEKQQKFVKVSAGSKEEAVTKAKKFYSKQGYHVHGAEYHSAMTVKEELDEAATSAAVRMQKALEKIKADRERKERLAEPYVATKSVFKKPIKEVIAGNLSCMSCGDTPCQCDSHTQMVETGKRKSFKRFTKDSKR
jgi:IMP dehydrogenase/GMP reductase